MTAQEQAGAAGGVRTSSAAATRALLRTRAGDPGEGLPAHLPDALTRLEAFEARVTPVGGPHAPVMTPVEDRRVESRSDRGPQLTVREALEEAHRLREANRWKDGFLAAAAHDLRGALAVITGAAQTLLADPELDRTRTLELARVVQRQSNKLGRLLEELLDSARFTSRVGSPECRPTDVGALVEGVVAETDWAGHPLAVETEPVIAELDPRQMEHVVANLLSNAVSHTPHGTSIRVAVSARGGRMLLVVEDDGPGIPQGIRGTLFDAFVTQGSHASDQGGTGIGLSLVQLFAELHDGVARVEDTEIGGARFVVDLPLGEP